MILRRSKFKSRCWKMNLNFSLTILVSSYLIFSQLGVCACVKQRQKQVQDAKFCGEHANINCSSVSISELKSATEVAASAVQFDIIKNSTSILSSTNSNSDGISHAIRHIVTLYKKAARGGESWSNLLSTAIKKSDSDNSVNAEKEEGRTFILLSTVLLFRSLSFIGQAVFFITSLITSMIIGSLLISSVTFIFSLIANTLFWAVTGTLGFVFFSGLFAVVGLIAFQTLTGGIGEIATG